jgi:DNA-binding ferritin-like protein
MFILPPNCIEPSATSLTISPVFPSFLYFIFYAPFSVNENFDSNCAPGGPIVANQYSRYPCRCHIRKTLDLLLDEHSEQILDMTDNIAERARKIGGTTLRSISDISRHQRLIDNNDETVAPKEMLAELSADNQALTRYFRSAHETCERYNDVATASQIEVLIDQTERRTRFLSEIVQGL